MPSAVGSALKSDCCPLSVCEEYSPASVLAGSDKHKSRSREAEVILLFLCITHIFSLLSREHPQQHPFHSPVALHCFMVGNGCVL